MRNFSQPSAEEYFDREHLGFKFIGNTALDLVKQGYDVPFGYEEAIGFMFGAEIRDKDGVAATVLEHLSTLSPT